MAGRTGLRRRALAAAAVGSITLPVTFAVLSSAHATQTVTTTRLGGSDRYDTARVIAAKAFPGGAATVLLARGENFSATQLGFPDALSGNYLAGNVGAPILLTNANSVPAPTLLAIKDLKTKNVTVLGLQGAVSDAVVAQLQAIDSTATGGGKLVVVRIGGGDRYETAEKIAETPPTTFVGKVGGQLSALIARGDNFPDALAAGPLADGRALPLILTNPDHLSDFAKKALMDLGIKQAFVLGDVGAVSAATEASINALGVATQRLKGGTRQLTAAAIGDFAINSLGFRADLVNLARGDDYPDALAGGPKGGKERSIVLLTGSATDLNADTRSYLRSRNQTISEIDSFGLQGAIADAVDSDAAGTTTCSGRAGTTTSTLPGTTTSTLPGTTTTTAVGATTTTVPACAATPTTLATSTSSTTSTTIH